MCSRRINLYRLDCGLWGRKDLVGSNYSQSGYHRLISYVFGDVLDFHNMCAPDSELKFGTGSGGMGCCCLVLGRHDAYSIQSKHTVVSVRTELFRNI